jgi:hypothetical protein
MVRGGGDDASFAHGNGKRQAAMVIRDETEPRTDSLNGFLGRWRRNASHAGILASAVALLAAAVAAFALCTYKAIR